MCATKGLPNFSTKWRVFRGFFGLVGKIWLGAVGHLSRRACSKTADGVGFRPPNAVFTRARHELSVATPRFCLAGHLFQPRPQSIAQHFHIDAGFSVTLVYRLFRSGRLVARVRVALCDTSQRG